MIMSNDYQTNRVHYTLEYLALLYMNMRASYNIVVSYGVI